LNFILFVMKIRKKIEVPYFKQKKNHTCGPASIKMVFRFFGLHAREAELARVMKTKKEGTEHSGLIMIARKNGFYCYVHENASLNQVKHFIDLGLPVIVNYLEPDSEEGHYAVVVGYGLRRIVLNDPWNGKEFKIFLKDFEIRWNERKRWMFVLSKKEFNVGKQYKPSFLKRFGK
jgi:ABC-type bacteriocin/lantibiotic exporter with double-glycine peptidase domain